MSPIAHSIEISPACPTRNFSNLHLWLEPTRLPYAGYDHILSK